MRTIRRLYFYTVSLVSLETILWGLISLLRTTFAADVIPGPETLAQALALVLVGVPIFGLHWRWVQRAAAHDPEEQSATLRAVFVYGVLFITLIPMLQNLLALINRTFVETAGMETYRALVGGQQSWQDNVIAIFFNGVAAAYFYTILRADWLSLPDQSNFADIRRLYRYLWVLYALVLVVFGAQQILRYIFYIPGGILGEVNREIFVNGMALLVVGTPVWLYAWQLCQRALVDSAEQGSTLRLGVLYLLALVGAITLLSAAGVTLDVILRRLLGESMTGQEFLRQSGGAVSIGIPFAGVWAYYGAWLSREIQALPDAARRAGLRRFYFYVLSVIGLGATLAGISLLIVFLVGQITGNALWDDGARGQLAGSLATLFVGLPVWLATWRPMQADAVETGDSGEHARRSLVRKAYLYFVIFAAVIAVMASAIVLAYLLINALLTGRTETGYLSRVLNALLVLLLFSVVLVYHFSSLRTDGIQAAGALELQHHNFPILILANEGSEFAEATAAAFRKNAPSMPISTQSIEQGLPRDAMVRGVVIPADLILNPPEALRLWLKEFPGVKVIVPVESKGWYWASGVPRNPSDLAAQIVRQLAEGQQVRPPTATSPWMIVAYVFAVLFGLQVLFLLFALGMSFIAN